MSSPEGAPAPPAKSGTGVRLASAAVALAIVIPILVWGGVTGVEIAASVVVVMLLDEFARMAAPKRFARVFAGLVVATVPVWVALLWAPAWSGGAFAIAAMVCLGVGLFAIDDTDEGARTALQMMGAVLYAPVLLSFIVALRRQDEGVLWILLTMAACFLGDTGAYFAGRAFGKRKLFVRISPKKTWEGFYGGLVASVVGTVAIDAIAIAGFGAQGIPYGHAAFMGLFVGLSGVAGDLAESMLKRSFDVKDSGWVMPGHGGVFDRLDSLLFGMPVAWIYAQAAGIA